MRSDTNLLGFLFYGEEVEAIFSPDRQLRDMVRFEIELAHALESCGVAPVGTGASLEVCSAGFPSSEQVEAIARGAALSGNIAIPFVKQFTAHVRSCNAEASDFAHFGATSQDVLDTALVLQLRDVFALIEEDMDRICSALVGLTEQHGETLLPGRTWLQQGPPLPFALKTAGWLMSMLRHRERLSAVRRRALVLQFGGAVGTLASLGARAGEVAEQLGTRLNLQLPEMPWHTQRDSLAEVGTTLGLLIGTVGKIARDLSLMMQTEVGEVREAAVPGKGGSSTMPHKRNPVGPAVVLAASLRAPGLVSTLLSSMVQEHERGLGGWHAEWETLPELCKLARGALRHTAVTLEGLEVDEIAMRGNLDRLGGLALAESVSMELSRHVGRPAAHRLLESASHRALENHLSIREVLRTDPEIAAHLSEEEIDEALKPGNYLGAAAQFISQVLTTAKQRLAGEDSDAFR